MPAPPRRSASGLELCREYHGSASRGPLIRGARGGVDRRTNWLRAAAWGRAASGLDGSGANSGQVRDPLPLRRITALDRHQAASASFHSSDLVASAPPSLPVLNCPFLIFSANSIPLIVTTAWSNLLNPSIGRIRCFTRRWSCSIKLFKYWLDRTFTRRGSSPSSFISRNARWDAA